MTNDLSDLLLELEILHTVGVRKERLIEYGFIEKITGLMIKNYGDFHLHYASYKGKYSDIFYFSGVSRFPIPKLNEIRG